MVCWVALCRSKDMDLSLEYRRTCPMLWCEVTFEPNESLELISHITGCSRLRDGEYFCPYHERPEYFMSKQNPVRSAKDARRLFLKDTFKAICRLGSKSIRKAIHPSKYGGWHGTRSPRKRSYGGGVTDVGSETTLLPPELSSTGMADFSFSNVSSQFPKRFSRSFVELADRRSCPVELENPFSAELPSEPFSRTLSTVIDIPPVASASSSPVSPIESERCFDSDGFDSPVSPSSLSSYSSLLDKNDEQVLCTAGTESHKHHANKLSAPTVPSRDDRFVPPGGFQSAMAARTFLRTYPNMRIETTYGGTKPTSMPSPVKDPVMSFETSSGGISQGLNDVPGRLQIEGETLNQRKLVEQLRGHFNFCFKMSCAKMSRLPMTPAADSFLQDCPSPAFIFNSGYMGLRTLVEGQLPWKFEEVWGITHLAYASAIGCQEDNLVGKLPQIHDDLLRWSEVITDDRKRKDYQEFVGQLFEVLVQRIKLPSEGHPEAFPQHTQTFAYGYHSSSGQILAQTRSQGWTTTQMHSSMRNVQQGCEDERRLQSALKEGITVQLCLQYLAGMLMSPIQTACVNMELAFEFGSLGIANCEHWIQSGGCSQPLNSYAHGLKQAIIDQLLEMPAVKPFWPCVGSAATLLKRAPRTTLRDIELCLIHQGKVSST